MNKKIASVFTVITILLSAQVFAGEEHPLSTIKGTNIDLKVYDHAFAGSIREFVAWGAMEEGQFKSELRMRKAGQTISANFGKTEDGIGGVIQYRTESGTKQTSIFFERLDKEHQTFMLKINGESVPVIVTSDKFVGNHFINPTYTAQLNGEKISFTLTGQACYGYSLHLVMMIIGAYVS
ncbi:MAG: hypothetical protein HY537_03695 [Deltaproteobacteria bacterium]|nr:hypothetical protein [Deltaproteobacteria bacterium]